MRMTNKIMQANSLYNINQTKLQEDKYNTQLTSQSKISRPSDDPVIAIRALRLRSNVSTVSQFYEKNSPDASQWLDVTAQSLNTITSVLTSLYNQVQTGVNKDYTSSDMQVLLTQIDAYTQEMYATGNQDYAGRYIFTGYRTDTALTMDENNLSQDFSITESIGESQIDSFSYTDYSVFDTVSGVDAAADQIELGIKNATLNRIRLSYNDCKDGVISLVVKDKDGADVTGLPTIDTSFTKAEDAYKAMLANEQSSPVASKVIYVAETGELLIDSNSAKKISDALTDGGSIQATYEKNKWNEKDLSPVHFFDCTDKTTGIHYNSGGDVNTEITYDVGYNQTIQVNTNAYEVFDPAINRDYTDLKNLVSQYAEIEGIRLKYQNEMDEYEESSEDYAKAKIRFEAADKAYTYIRDAVSVRFGEQITKYQQYLDATNVAITKNGTRSTRLELIHSRLSDQKSTFQELQEENEGIDMTEVAVKLTSAETTYDAALLATSKIMQNSLIKYI